VHKKGKHEIDFFFLNVQTLYRVKICKLPFARNELMSKEGLMQLTSKQKQDQRSFSVSGPQNENWSAILLVRNARKILETPAAI
jgi:hypothetical protein